MSVEWDEELARQLFQNLGGSLAAWSVDFWTFFQMGKSEHDRADAEHAARLEAEASMKGQRERIAAWSAEWSTRLTDLDAERDALAEQAEALKARNAALEDAIRDWAPSHIRAQFGIKGWMEHPDVVEVESGAALTDQEGR